MNPLPAYVNVVVESVTAACVPLFTVTVTVSVLEFHRLFPAHVTFTVIVPAAVAVSFPLLTLPLPVPSASYT